MRKITLLMGIFLGLAFQQVDAQQNNGVENDLTRMNLNGSVKSVDETVYHVQKENKTIVKGEQKYHEKTFFNGKGNKTKILYASSPDRSHKDTYAYNSRDQLTVHKVYDNLIGLIKKDVYEYTVNHTRAKHTHYEGIEGDLYKQEVEHIDENGLTKEILTFSEDDSMHPAHRDFYSYVLNDQNRIRSMSVTSDNGVTYKTEHSYDEDGNLIEEKEYRASPYTRNASGLRERILTYNYDQYGNDTLHTVVEPEGQPEINTRQKFTYDKKRNWTRKMVFEKNKALYIHEREITYYQK